MASNDPRPLRWMPLDNAAKIYPAARRKDWSNVYRLSLTLTEEVDRAVLQSALDATVPRFPSIAARLRRGVFWYYLQEVSQAPQVRQEHSYPLARMGHEEMRRCAFRVIVYHRRIAVEFFHALTDGNGALVFLKTLAAEYLQQKHGLSIPCSQGVLDRNQEPEPGELEDSFLKYAGPVAASRKAEDAWHLSGTPEPDGFLHVTCLQIPADRIHAAAHDHGATVSAFLGAAMLMALQRLQAAQVPEQKKRKPLKVLLPVNLRRLFPSTTLRNFALYTTPQIDPRLGEFSLREICDIVRCRMGLDIRPKHMASMMAANVGAERMLLVRAVPLFLKNLIMKAVFSAVGERKSCLSLSNLGRAELPREMAPYVARMDFILGIQATAPYNCGAITWGDTLYVNVIRNVREPDLERSFFEVLRDLGIPVTVESNQR